MNTPNMPTAGTCDICGRLHDYCDGETCDECGRWACHRCMTGIPGRRLCEDCQEAEKDGYPEDEMPDVKKYHKAQARHKYNIAVLEERVGK